jgi:ABC-2 type transport system ATP-binding protein
MSVAEAVCDRIGILHRGKIIATGTTTELRSNRALEDVFLELTYGND